MSDAARRKELKRLKRDKKKAQHRRAMAVSPYKRIGHAGKLEACYISAGWQESGIATIHLVRENPEGGFALGCFLIDVWCAGLKDAWGNLNLLHDDIDRHMDHAKERVDLIRIEPEAARSLVAGAIRFGRQNGFRLPPRYERWLHLLGEIPDPASADLQPFGKDGGLLWIGSLEELEKRLIGCSLDDFLDRPDVDFISPEEDFSESEWDDEFEEDDALEAMDQTVEAICQQLTRFCADQGEQIPSLMREAVQLIIAARLRTLATAHPEAGDESAGDPHMDDPPLTIHGILGPELASKCEEPLKAAVLRVAQLTREMVAAVSSADSDDIQAEEQLAAASPSAISRISRSP